MRAAIVGLVLLASPAAADDSMFPLAVPPACQGVAQQHGIPQTITNRRALLSAIAVLSRLSSKDEAVRDCKAVVRAAFGK